MLVSITFESAMRALPERAPDAHKGLFGHTFIFGGAPGMSGAVRLAGEAALRVGAGKVTIATAPEHAHFLNIGCPELMTHGVQGADDLAFLAGQANTMILGPGMGHSPAAQTLLSTAVTFKRPMVVDADALQWLAQQENITNQYWILTPHPGEAAKLLGCQTIDIQQDRVAAVRAIQAKWGGVVVLKGAGTLIAGPNQPIHICPAANPAMATAGMGDILSGLIGGLVSQGMGPFEAAVLGTILHAYAADRACQGTRGLLASDIFPFIGPLLNNQLS